MTARILLIRHAAHDDLGHILSGRTPARALTATGRAQAERLGRRLAKLPINHLHSSPVQRALETAAAIAAHRPGIDVEIAPAIDEIDFGAWAGRAFAELADDPAWDRWNRNRAEARAPGGETMQIVQQRIWTHAVHAALRHPGETIALVSHCDLIRAAIARVLGLSLDRLPAFEVAPASVSQLEVGAWGARVLSVNEQGDG